MDTDFSPPLTIDLTGLPAPVVRSIVLIVEAARAGVSPPADLAPSFISRPRPTLEESRRNRAGMAAMSSGQSLPLDFSSADIYDDSRPELTTEEFLKLLDKMQSMSSGQSLPLDFSSADIYDDHD